ncbi:transcriptional regulator, TetR family [Lentilactobacillus kisonensis F0435]|uniref:Transcriptional regulator, TetR family n=3 Tax=Lentilactobacillus kisonensis TaxID=481722 RepID=H1LHJ3_9LACO|nr:transcriptional regulator, TetR family [Lentilactobacillus kisonensis F0435]
MNTTTFFRGVNGLEEKMENKKKRRRGETLKQAILDAAWDTMQAIGYQKMTMDDIAKKAETNKNAIYRRWDSKQQIIFEVAREKILDAVDFKAPNSGRVRDDLIQILSQPLGIIQMFGIDNIRGYANDTLPQIHLTGHTAILDNQFTKVIQLALSRGYDRGELTKDVADGSLEMKIIPDLVIFASLMLRNTITKTDVSNWVDQIILPIYGYSK